MTILDHRVELGSPTGGAGTGGREYTASLFVDSDDPMDTGHAVLSYILSAGFMYGSKWEFGNDENESVRLCQIDPPQFIGGSAYTWNVQLRYKEIRVIGSYAGSVVSPELWQPKIRVRTTGRMAPVTRGTYLGGLMVDWPLNDYREITNSAGAVFSDPPLEEEKYNCTIRVSRRTGGVLFSKVAFPTFWVNEKPFVLYNDFIVIQVDKRELKFTGWEVDEEQYEGIDLVRVEFTGELKPGGWTDELLDQGYTTAGCAPDGGRDDGRGGKYYDSEDPANIAGMKNILDRNGNHPRSPVPLDGKGNALGDCDKNRFYGKWLLPSEIDVTTLGFFAGITGVPNTIPGGPSPF